MNDAQKSDPGQLSLDEKVPPHQRFSITLWWTVIVACVALFAASNLPWNLDDYDQAKQAFISFQMIGQHRWLFQTTPEAGSGGAGARHTSFHNSSKPPAVGWISVAFYEVTRSWEAAWRLPSFLAAGALAFLLFRSARDSFGTWPALVALAAFGLNFLSARLATLVRTDMPLALVSFAIGLLFFQKTRGCQSWSQRDRILLFVLLLGGMFIKGPIVWAFILPPLLIYQVWRRRRPDFPSIWSGWWPWLVSFVAFLCWVMVGIFSVSGFYDDVVRVEFLGRFHEGIHRSQPLFFYLPHLLQKFAPWSLLMIGLLLFVWRQRNLRLVRMSPETFWLAAWALGGIAVMSLIPSKRVDRIFPAIPPLCLLLTAQISFVIRSETAGVRLRKVLVAAILFAILYAGSYSAARVIRGYRTNSAALVKFGRDVRHLAFARNLRYEVVSDKRESVDEGLLLYLRRPRFVRLENARELWGAGSIDSLVVPAIDGSEFPGAVPLLSVTKKDETPRSYIFLSRPSVAKP